MRELIVNLTVEQFSQFVGMLISAAFFFILFWVLCISLLDGIFDGWLFRKGALYYGSFRYLNKLFKKLRNCGTAKELENLCFSLTKIITLLYFQRVIPKFIFNRLNSKLDYIYEKRKIEISDYWSC